MKYVVAKLLSGETLVALRGEIRETSINLVYPFEVYKEIRYDEEEGKQYTYTGLKPFCSYSEETVYEFNKAAFAFMVPLKDDLAEIYCQMVEALVTPDIQQDVVKAFRVEGSSTLQ
jgi:hypothetical protein